MRLFSPATIGSMAAIALSSDAFRMSRCWLGDEQQAPVDEQLDSARCLISGVTANGDRLQLYRCMASSTARHQQCNGPDVCTAHIRKPAWSIAVRRHRTPCWKGMCMSSCSSVSDASTMPASSRYLDSNRVRASTRKSARTCRANSQALACVSDICTSRQVSSTTMLVPISNV